MCYANGDDGDGYGDYDNGDSGGDSDHYGDGGNYGNDRTQNRRPQIPLIIESICILKYKCLVPISGLKIEPSYFSFWTLG